MQSTNPQPWSGIPITGPFFRPLEAAKYIRISKTRFYDFVAQGRLPRPIKLGDGDNAAGIIPQGWLDAFVAAKADEIR